MKELIKIQSELNAPKTAYNPFGKFNYRTAESILAALKPLLTKYDCYLTINDELIQVGDRYYVKATATLVKDIEDGEEEFVATTAYARESDSKSGMDSMQITGAASSYARKYALNGLFAIDDNRDADADAPATPAKTVTGTTSNGKIATDQGSPTTTTGTTSNVKVTETTDSKTWLNPDNKNWDYTVKRLSEGVAITEIEKVFKISKENKKKLIEQSTKVVTGAA